MPRDENGGAPAPAKLRRMRKPVPQWFRDAAAMRQAARGTYGQRIYGPGHFWPPSSRKGGPDFYRPPEPSPGRRK